MSGGKVFGPRSSAHFFRTLPTKIFSHFCDLPPPKSGYIGETQRKCYPLEDAEIIEVFLVRGEAACGRNEWTRGLIHCLMFVNNSHLDKFPSIVYSSPEKSITA